MKKQKAQQKLVRTHNAGRLIRNPRRAPAQKTVSLTSHQIEIQQVLQTVRRTEIGLEQAVLVVQVLQEKLARQRAELRRQLAA